MIRTTHPAVPSEAKECTGKKRWPSAADAEHAAKRQRKKTKKRMDIYACRFCDGWHLARRQK